MWCSWAGWESNSEATWQEAATGGRAVATSGGIRVLYARVSPLQFGCSSDTVTCRKGDARAMQGFTGDGRFEVRERLGDGGFGTVYAAFDRELGIPVAVKHLRQQSPDSIYRFKKEFRLLAEMAHPNLVSLYELFQSK